MRRNNSKDYFKVQCSECHKFSNIKLEEVPRIKLFHTLNFQCKYCQSWLRIDFIVGPSLIKPGTQAKMSEDS